MQAHAVHAPAWLKGSAQTLAIWLQPELQPKLLQLCSCPHKAELLALLMSKFLAGLVQVPAAD